MSALINQLGSFIQYIFDGIEQIILFFTDVLVWLTNFFLGIKFLVGTICPDEIGFVVLPILVSMFAFLGIKLLVRLL